jgi:hypothetical protein
MLIELLPYIAGAGVILMFWVVTTIWNRKADH